VAILVDFQKVREDKQEVEYIYGYPEMDHRLVITKETREGRPLAEEKDRNFAPVYVKIIRQYASEGHWPERGMYAA
jgi:hypothetical protein